MTAVVHVKSKLIPWDDPAFVRAYEEIRAEVEAAGCCPDIQDAGFRVQHLLRERGFAKAHVDVHQNVDDALEQVSHWTVRRDG